MTHGDRAARCPGSPRTCRASATSTAIREAAWYRRERMAKEEDAQAAVGGTSFHAGGIGRKRAERDWRRTPALLPTNAGWLSRNRRRRAQAARQNTDTGNAARLRSCRV